MDACRATSIAAVGKGNPEAALPTAALDGLGVTDVVEPPEDERADLSRVCGTAVALVEDADGEWRLTERRERLPLTYTLRARRTN